MARTSLWLFGSRARCESIVLGVYWCIACYNAEPRLSGFVSVHSCVKKRLGARLIIMAGMDIRIPRVRLLSPADAQSHTCDDLHARSEHFLTTSRNKFRWTREIYGKDYICSMERKPDPRVEICL